MFVHTTATASQPAAATSRTRPATVASSASAKEKLSLRPRWRSAVQAKPLAAQFAMIRACTSSVIGRDEADAPDAGKLEDLAERQHRGAGGHAARRGDALAQALVALEAEPARRGAVPGDRVDLGVGQELGGAQDLGVVELRQGARD